MEDMKAGKEKKCRTVYCWMGQRSVFMKCGIGGVQRQNFKREGPWKSEGIINFYVISYLEVVYVHWFCDFLSFALVLA